MSNPVNITLHRWAGAWGPFRIKVPCGECTLTEAIIEDCLANELADVQVRVRQHDWLSNWWRPLLRGGWHAPIVQVDGKVVSQGLALNRGLLVQAVIAAAGARPLTGTHVYGKAGCPHCAKAKANLQKASLPHQYHDVVKDSTALYEMLARVKPIIGAKTPVTVPQIWLEGRYIGGADALDKALHAT